MSVEETLEVQHRVLPVVEDAGNRRLLAEWLDEHPTYEHVAFTGDFDETTFDVCIIDRGGFETHLDALREQKTAAAPVLLPYLLLIPESGADLAGTDAGELADNVVTETVDELVTLPIQQAELHWRLSALLRLREQSLTLRTRERELERRVDLFEKVQTIANVGGWEYDVDAGTTWWSDEIRRIYGLSGGETLSLEGSLRYYHPQDRPRVREAFEAAVDSGEPYDLEVRFVDEDGTHGWVRTRGEPQYENGELSRVRGTIQDITERKRREERLRRRTRAIDEAPVGISISDPSQTDNPMIYVNDAFVEMTGYTREAALGDNCRFLHGENTDPEQVDRIREAIDAQEPIAVDIRNYRRDGTEFWNHLEIAPVRDTNGGVVNWIGFQQDVTERKERQQQLDVLDRVLRHNIRNDMNVIRGQAEIIQAKTAGDLTTAAEQIVDTSNQLMSMADKEREITELLRGDPTHEEIDLRPLLHHVASTAKAEHPEATVTVDCPAGTTVRATTRFAEALDELVTNGITHDDSSPDVGISVTETDDTVRIEVADTGPPIPEMERELLEGLTNQTPLYHGSGLGLWLVRLIVSRSGGTIACETTDSVGNVVRVELSN